MEVRVGSRQIKKILNTEVWVIIFVRIIKRRFGEKVKSGSY